MENVKIFDVLKVVDEWLNSDDVFVTDKQGGKVIPGAWVDCKKGSLLKRLCLINGKEVTEVKANG